MKKELRGKIETGERLRVYQSAPAGDLRIGEAPGHKNLNHKDYVYTGKKS